MVAYEVIKVHAKTGKTINYGTYDSMEDVKLICKGYKFNGLFFSRLNSKWFYMINEKNI